MTKQTKLDFVELFNQNEQKLEQVDPSHISDEILRDISNNIDEIKNEIQVYPGSENQRADQKDLHQAPQISNRFAELTSENVNEIADESVKKTTHKQTRWGIKVLRGIYVLFLKNKVDYIDLVSI